MNRSKHRSWFQCTCGNTFRSVTNRRRGLRKCPSCQKVADHRAVVPAPATDHSLKLLELDVIDAACATATAYRCNMTLSTMRRALHDLNHAVTAWTVAIGKTVVQGKIVDLENAPPHGG